MRDRALEVVKRLGKTFGGFTPGQKAVTLLGVVALVAGALLFSRWASAPTYTPLFSNLSATDASAIVDKLNSSGTTYQLADGGATIMVPQSQVYDLRLKMSGQGLPAQADTGYSLLDKQGLTTSDFMQNVDYQRALEGELDKTIKSIDGVQDAAVHLAIPQKDVFATDSQKPTASVLVTTALGRTLSPDQVQSVVHLVAASVVGLDPTQVTVSDSAGNVLSAGNGQPLSTGSSGRDQQTQQFEQRVDDAVQKMMDSVVGAGHAVVKTTADLNYDQTETKTQTYVAPSPSTPPLSQSSDVETYNGTGGTSGGVLGPDNIQVPTGTGGGTGTYNHSTSTVDNAVGMVTQTTKSAPGNVRRMSIAVLLDSTTAKNADLAQLQKLVSNAAGLDATRGDTIAVSAMAFDQSAAQQQKQADVSAAKAASQAQLMSMAKTGGLALVIAVLVFLAWRASKKARRSELTAGENAALDRIQAVLDKRATPALADGTGEALAIGPAEGMSPEALALEQRHREISEMVEQQPDEVAQLLRGWLAERRG